MTTATANKKEIIVLEQSAFDATNIPSSVSSIKEHLTEAVDIALGGVSVEQFIVDNKIDLSKTAHQRKLTGIATAVSKSKTLFAGLIKERQEEAAIESKQLLEIRKEFVSFCDLLRDEIQKPVKDYKAEQERKKLEAEQALHNIARYRTPVNEGGMYCETMGITQIDELLANIELIDTDDERFHTLKEQAKVEVEQSKAWLKEQAYQKLLQAQEQARIEEEKRKAQELAAFERQLNDIKMFAEPSHVGGRILQGMSSESIADLMSQLMRVELSGIRLDDLKNQRFDVYKTLDYAKGLAKEREAKKAEDEDQYRIDKFHGMVEQANNTGSRSHGTGIYEEASISLISVNTLIEYFKSHDAKGIDEQLRASTMESLQNEFNKISENIGAIKKRLDDSLKEKREAELEQARQEERQRIEQEAAARQQQYRKNDARLSLVRAELIHALMASNETIEGILKQDPTYNSADDEGKARYVKSKMFTQEEATAAATALVKCLKYGIELPHIEIKAK